MQSGICIAWAMTLCYTLGVINMSIKINFDKIKLRCQLFFSVSFFGCIAWGFYEASVPDITDLLTSRSIVYFFWGSFFLLLTFPVLCCFTLSIAYVAFTKDMVPPKCYSKGITIGYHCMGAGFVIGNILSFIVLFYPLGTNYVLCQALGPVSGAYFTRTESICEQLKYVRKTKPSEDVQKLKDELDGVLQH